MKECWQKGGHFWTPSKAACVAISESEPGSLMAVYPRQPGTAIKRGAEMPRQISGTVGDLDNQG